MAVTTARITCAADQYTALSAGQASVSFTPKVSGGKLVIATSTPSAGETNFVTVKGGEEVSIGNLGISDNVYWMPSQVGGDTIEVVRG